ncbi:RNA-directed DNA methylation 4-like isoform X2 [Silene latifolia]|uniref:RNA-directed DNA methylation 4-like isoform X2 n=1 Tax=Silene latifolia TaxID=37657 RepID=UPI003D77C871
MESSEAERGQVLGEISSTQPSYGGGEKPVIVRVKRKLRQSPLEALWIEINERPMKRPLLDFQKLSITSSSSSSPPLEEPKVKRVLVQHIETVGRSEDAIEFVNSYVEGSPEVDGDSKFTASSKQRRRTLLSQNIHNRHLSKAKQQHEELAKSARFEQIWKRRTHDNESVHTEALDEVCRVYDVVRVDMEETSTTQEKLDEISEEDQKALGKFTPLLRECIPTAAEEIESDFSCQASKQGSIDGYVYDLYAVKEKVDELEVSYPFPLVQLDDDDQYYEGPDNSDYETDDSNAENNPYNDYPEEESSESEEKTDTSGSEESKENESEDETESDASFQSRDSVSDQLWDDEMDENFSDDFSDADSEGLP